MTCKLTQDNQVCKNCDATVTAPDGTTSTVSTDANGDFQLVLTTVGTYQVANGQSTVPVTALQPTTTVVPITQPQSAPAKGEFPWWIIVPGILIVLGILVVGYWYITRKKKK
jgi:hypothetical protein